MLRVLGSACLWKFMVGLLLGELIGGELVGWPEPDSFGGNSNPAGIRRDPEESGGILWKYRNSYPAGIPAKNPVKVAENRNFQDPSKSTFLWTNSSEKNKKSQESFFFLFFGPKNKFLSNRNYQPRENLVSNFIFLLQPFLILFCIVFNPLTGTKCLDLFPIDEYFLTKNRVVAES